MLNFCCVYNFCCVSYYHANAFRSSGILTGSQTRAALLEHLERESPYSREELELAISRGELVIDLYSATIATKAWRERLVAALSEESGIPRKEVATEFVRMFTNKVVEDWDVITDGFVIEFLERGGRCSLS